MTYKINQKSGIIQLLLLSLILLAVSVQAQDVSIRDAISFQEKKESFAKQSDNAARLFDQLIDGAPNAIFFRLDSKGEIEPGDIGSLDLSEKDIGSHIRPEGVVSSLHAQFPDEALKLLDIMRTSENENYKKHLSTIRVIRMKWDGKSSFQNWSPDSDIGKRILAEVLPKMESLEYIFVQVRPGADKKQSVEVIQKLDELMKAYEPDHEIQVLYRFLEPAQ